MSSTGEVACFGENMEEAFLKSLKSSNVPIPDKGSSILICIDDEEKIELVKRLKNIGYHINAGNNLSNQILEENGIITTFIENNDCDNIKNNKVDLVLDFTENSKENYSIRRNAIDYNTSLITNDEQIKLLVNSIEKNPDIHYKSHCEYFDDSY